jgi:hypothetical protein
MALRIRSLRQPVLCVQLKETAWPGLRAPGQRRSRMEDAMKAAIVRINELIVAALIFGAVIGLVAHLSSLDAPNYLSHIPHYLSRSLFPGNGYRAI